MSRKLTIPVRVFDANKEAVAIMLEQGKILFVVDEKTGIRKSYRKGREYVIETGMVVERMLQNGDYVVFNRQPTLHKYSMMAYEVVIGKQLTIGLHLSVTIPHNADFDGDEGNIWEAAMAAAHYKLDNLIVILDHNRLQIDGQNKDVMGIEPIDEKFKAFGWNIIVIDGHNFEEIINALNEADKVKGKPKIIIANTIKGKGVPYMENKAEWHGKACTPEELKLALKELDQNE